MKKPYLMGTALLIAFCEGVFAQSIQTIGDRKDGCLARYDTGIVQREGSCRVAHVHQRAGKNVDPKGVFSVTQGVIRITGEEWGGLVTEETFSNYRLSVEYRWLGTRFGSKTKAALDSGILFHSTGVDGGFGGIWMASHEYNLIQGASGDFWTCIRKARTCT
jgi:hypothetical protein